MSEAWSRYWARETSGACLPGAPAAVQERLAGVWREAARAMPEAARVIDVAAGAGAVTKLFADVSGTLQITGIDAADVGPAAARLGVTGGIDAHALPFGDASFDAVVSQFGLEYCGPAAWAEATRVLAPGGRLLIICHHAASAAVGHNGRRLAAMQALAEAGLFALAQGLAAGHGEDARLMAAVLAARDAHGDQSVVKELPMALGHWARAGRGDAVAAIQAEAEAEMARLAAMQAAALDKDGVAARVAWLQPVAARAEVLDGPDGVMGWVISGLRAG